MAVVTPVFRWNRGEALLFLQFLTADVLSSVFDVSVAPPKGARFCFVITQDAFGGHIFTWPTICRGAPLIGFPSWQVTIQVFSFIDGLLIASGPPMYLDGTPDGGQGYGVGPYGQGYGV